MIVGKSANWFVLAGILAAPACFAASESEAHREHEAHVHGKASMNLALAGGRLVVELLTPAVNIVGFEHPPRSEAEGRAVDEAVAALERGGEWLTLPPRAGCRLEAVEVETGLMESGESGEHGHEERGHDDHHDETHSEFHVNYAFQCENPGALDAVRVNWFQAYPGMEKIELQAVTDARQIGGELTPAAPVIRLRE